MVNGGADRPVLPTGGEEGESLPFCPDNRLLSSAINSWMICAICCEPGLSADPASRAGSIREIGALPWTVMVIMSAVLREE
ncbi:hypothetical protein DF035_07760 [Burkholderia contaminans]|nr:hypothetical protein DF035_07760 [Burkholderia contaminans]